MQFIFAEVSVVCHNRTACARSSTDRVPVFGTVDVGSIPAGRTQFKKGTYVPFFVYLCKHELCRLEVSVAGSRDAFCVDIKVFLTTVSLLMYSY